MRKNIALLTALCLMIVPVISLAEEEFSSNYFWSTDTQFDLYDLGFSIVSPESWTHVDDETLAAMNTEDKTDVASQLSLTPSVIAYFTNADATDQMLILCEDVEDPSAVVTPDQYIELFVNDMLSYSSASGSGTTFTYDTANITDATLGSQTFREMAITCSDGSILDVLVCHSGIGTYYTFLIQGSADTITTFAQEFVSSVTEIEAVG